MAVPCELITVFEQGVLYDENCDRILTTKEKFLVLVDNFVNFLTDSKTIVVFLIIAIAIMIYYGKKFPEGRVIKAYKLVQNFITGNKLLVILGLGISMIIIPIMMPNQSILKAAIQNDVSYLIAVSLSTFLGVRYGLIICAGIIITVSTIFKLKS